MDNRTIQTITYGPYQIVGFSKYKIGCLECVVSRLKDNLYGHFEGNRSFLEDPVDQIMIAALEEKLLEESENSQSVYLYDGIQKQIEHFKVFNYPQCSCSKTIESKSVNDKTEYVRMPEYRICTFDQIVEKLQPYMSTLIHPIHGVLKNHYKAISDAMPLIALEGQLGERNFDAYGRQSDYRTSYYTALLEGLERIHGVASFKKSIFYGSEEELVGDYLSLQDFIHYSDVEKNNPAFEFTEYKRTNNIKWMQAEHLRNGRSYYVPEQLVHFSNEQLKSQDGEKEQRYIYESSNGMAMGSTVEEAVLSGLLEVIERDSFLVHWYLKKEPVRITQIEALQSSKINMMLNYLNYFGYHTHIFDITLESDIPAIWVLLEAKDKRDEERLCFYTAGGSSFSLEKAIESALIEAATSIKVYNHYLQKRYDHKNAADYRNDYQKVVKLEDHIFLYSSEEMASVLDFALHSKKEQTCAALVEHYNAVGKSDFDAITQTELLERVVTKLEKSHPDIYFSELTSSSLREIGLECVKVIIPTMQNISFGHQYKNVNSQRLQQIAGNKEAAINHNLVPHPFP